MGAAWRVPSLLPELETVAEQGIIAEPQKADDIVERTTHDQLHPCQDVIDRQAPSTLGGQVADALGWAHDTDRTAVSPGQSSGTGAQDPTIVQGKTGHTSLPMTQSPMRDVSGKFRGSLVVLKDINQRKAMENQLRELPEHDPLTGLFNRRVLEGLGWRALDKARHIIPSRAILQTCLIGYRLRKWKGLFALAPQFTF